MYLRTKHRVIQFMELKTNSFKKVVIPEIFMFYLGSTKHFILLKVDALL